MASETALPDQSTHVENKRADDVKESIENESVSQSKDGGKDEKLEPKIKELSVAESVVTEAEEKVKDHKVDDLLSVEAIVTKAEEKDKATEVEEIPTVEAVVTKAEEKVNETEVEEIPTVQAVVTKAEEMVTDPKVEEIPTVEAVVTESEEKASVAQAIVTEPEEKTKDNKIDAPAVEVGEKVEDNDKDPIVDVSVDAGPKPMESSEPIPVESVVPEMPAEVGENGPEEQPKTTDTESSSEVVAQKAVENSEASPAQEPELEAGKEVEEVSDSVAKLVEKAKESSETSIIAVSVAEEHSTKEKTLEQSAVSVIDEPVSKATEEVVDKEIGMLDTKESVVGEIPEDEKASGKKDEAETESSKDEQSTEEDVNLAAVSDKIEDETNKAPEFAAIEATTENSKDDGLKVAVEPEVSECVEEKKKEERSIDLVEGLVKEVAVEVGLPDPSPALSVVKELETTPMTEIAANLIKSDIVEGEKEEKSVKIEESTPSETTKTEDVRVSESVAEVLKSSSEEEKATRDVEVVTDGKKEETGEDDTLTCVEAPKDRDVEEAVQIVVDAAEKLEEKNEEAGKADAQKDRGESKTDTDTMKHEVSVKTTHRQSNNIISKVKQSIVKVKKAIIGKSPSSKTISTEAKDDIKVK